MNAAARLLNNQGLLSRGWVVSVLLSRSQFSMVALIASVLISGIGVVYATNTARTLNASIQQTYAERDRLHIQWGQLLLEKSTWGLQTRIQGVAENQLGMEIPNNKSVVVIHE